jgi:predicted nucleic acid-binding protein
MSFALDVNILLYASDSGSPHFERAKSFIESCIAQKEVFLDVRDPLAGKIGS